MATELQVVPARRGQAVRLAEGQAIQIINTHGQQGVDTWCFKADDMAESLSMEHMHASLQGIFPAKGDALVTNHRRPIVILEEDTSPGRHDTVIAACDVHRYALLGCTGYHDNCTDNLHAALAVLGLQAPDCPSPLNLWMNIPVAPDGRITWGVPLCKTYSRLTVPPARRQRCISGCSIVARRRRACDCLVCLPDGRGDQPNFSRKASADRLRKSSRRSRSTSCGQSHHASAIMRSASGAARRARIGLAGMPPTI